MKYVKRPMIVIDAVQWTGDNIEELKEFVGDSLVIEETICSCVGTNEEFSRISSIYIKTLEGGICVNLYDYLVKEGVLGEFYTCSPNIFEATYDEVEDK